MKIFMCGLCLCAIGRPTTFINNFILFLLNFIPLSGSVRCDYSTISFLLFYEQHRSQTIPVYKSVIEKLEDV